MACFTIPLAEALVVSAVKFTINHTKKNAADVVKNSNGEYKFSSVMERVNYLEKMLYGGSFLLAIEHIYHGEVTFVPPFLTAMNTPEEIPVMLHEMATVGVGMALLTTAVWGIGVLVAKLLSKKNNPLAGANV